VSIKPKQREKEKARNLKTLQNMICNTGIIDPDLVKQFIKLLVKGEGNVLIKTYPELDLAITNLPEKFRNIALGEDIAEETEGR